MHSRNSFIFISMPVSKYFLNSLIKYYIYFNEFWHIMLSLTFLAFQSIYISIYAYFCVIYIFIYYILIEKWKWNIFYCNIIMITFFFFYFRHIIQVLLKVMEMLVIWHFYQFEHILEVLHLPSIIKIWI